MGKHTIIYVFGPKRLYEKYINGHLISQKEGGWLKIGMTNPDSTVDKWDAALNRARDTIHTGVPEVCTLYEVYEYPELEGKPDDKVRLYLTDDLYEVSSSRKDNQNIEDRDIKAGREFVYELSQKHVQNAIGMFERDLVMEMYQTDRFEELMDCLKRNQEDDSSDDSDECGSSESPSQDPSDSNSEWTIWNRVIDKIRKDIPLYLRGRNDSQPFFFNSPTHKDFKYYVAYNKKRAISYVEFRTTNGEDGLKELSKLVEDADVKKLFPDANIRRGKRNSEKWAFTVSDTLEDKTDDDVVDWYADTILKLSRAFNDTKDSAYNNYASCAETPCINTLESDSSQAEDSEESIS